MVRVNGRADVVWPRGDTGSIQIHVPYHVDEGDISLFLVFDRFTRKVLAEQVVILEDDYVTVPFGQELAWRLMPGKYFWDVKLYHDPIYDDEGRVMGALTIDSIYGAFKQPSLTVTEV